MWVYIVVQESHFREENVKVFTSEAKANAYAEQQAKIAPYYTYRVETHWAI